MAADTFTFPDDFATNPTAAVGPKSLDGTPYLFRFVPNARAYDGVGTYLLDIRTADGTPLDLGRKLILTGDLWASVKGDDERLPQGQLIVRRVEGEGDPGLNDLGLTVVVEYNEVGG